MTLVLVGPTAVGKSRLAVALAQQLAAAGRPAEVVNADSMLVYRGMDIGTAKPTLAERDGVRHHLIDIMEVQETATVAEFQRMARAAIADCRERGVVPVVVGGSALYIRAIVDKFESRHGLQPRLSFHSLVNRFGSWRCHGHSCFFRAAARALVKIARIYRCILVCHGFFWP